MSVVLLGPSGELGQAVYGRLSGQGDDVRVVVHTRGEGDLWKSAGAYVAVAPEWDADLIERASYEARTLVLFPIERGEDVLLSEVLQGAVAASVDRLIVLRADAVRPSVLTESQIDHVVLGIGKRSLLRRRQSVEEALVAEAVDAADDLPGNPRLVADLTSARDRAELGI